MDVTKHFILQKSYKIPKINSGTNDGCTHIHIVQHTYESDVGWGKNIACKDKSINIKSKTIIAISYKKIAVYFVLIIFSK